MCGLQACTGTNSHAVHLCVCLSLFVLIERLCILPSHAAVPWYSLRWAVSLLGGWDRPRKALSPFCQSIGIEWIIYVTPGRLPDSSETEQHRILLGNLEARGQSRNLWEVGWGIPGEAEVTSEGKLNDKKQKGGVGSGGMEHTFKLWFVQCVYIHAAIYHRYHTHTASHTDIST